MFDIGQQLFPNPLTMLVQLCATFILFLVLYKKLWNPAREFLSKRQALMEDEIRAAKQLNLEAKDTVEKSKEKLSLAVAQASKIVSKAQSDALLVKDEIVQDAKKQADNYLRKASDDILQQELKLRADLKAEIVDVALKASEKLLNKKLDASDDVESIERFVEEFSNEVSK